MQNMGGVRHLGTKKSAEIYLNRKKNTLLHISFKHGLLESRCAQTTDMQIPNIVFKNQLNKN